MTSRRVLKKRSVVFGVVLLFAQTVYSQSTDDPVAIKAVVARALSSAPLFIAQDEGYFKEEGLDAELLSFARSASALPALISGELDVIVASLTPSTLNAIHRGANLKIVAAIHRFSSDGCVSIGFVTRRDLVEGGELKTASDLRGRRIAVERSSQFLYFIERLLALGGLTTDDVIVVDSPLETRSEAINKAKIDLSLLAEPWLTRALDGGNAIMWLPATEVVPNGQSSFILYGPNLLEKNREVGNKFMAAYLRGVKQYSTGKTDRNVAILSERTGLEPEFLLRACWPPCEPSGAVSFDYLADFQSWAHGKGLVDSQLPLETVIDTTFVRYATKTLE